MSSLSQRLGYPEDARLLIVTGDDLGSSHSANVGTYQALRHGALTSAGLMVPCPWARDAAARHQTSDDVGVQLTLNAEHERFRWGPITQAPSLLDGDGGFPRTREDLWDHADLDEVRRESRAQVERALLWGVDVTHLSSHLASLELRPEFFDIALDLAVEFGLPLRLGAGSTERQAGFPFRTLAEEAGIVCPDRCLTRKWPGRAAAGADRLQTPQELEYELTSLPAGVSELVLRPAAGSEELRAMAADWRARVDDHRWATDPDGLAATAQRIGVHLIGYRRLREAQRGPAPAEARALRP